MNTRMTVTRGCLDQDLRDKKSATLSDSRYLQEGTSAFSGLISDRVAAVPNAEPLALTVRLDNQDFSTAKRPAPCAEM